MVSRIILYAVLVTCVSFFILNLVNKNTHTSKNKNIIFLQNFSHRQDQTYTEQMFLEDFADCKICNQHSVYSNLHQLRIVNGELAVTFEKDEIGSKLLFKKKLDKNYKELFLTFTIRFDKNYDQNALGGKLMGLAGAPSKTKIPLGCVSVHEDSGFSSRFTYTKKGILTNYIYHQDKTQECGEANYIKYDNGDFFKFIKDRYYIIEMRTMMNDPGFSNGFVETYINGKLISKVDGYIFSKTGNYGINTFLFDLYIGGKSDGFKLKNNSTLYIDNFIISTKRVFNDIKIQ